MGRIPAALTVEDALAALKSEEGVRTDASTAASSPWLDQRLPACISDRLLIRVLSDSDMREDVDRKIIEILTGRRKGGFAGEDGSSSSLEAEERPSSEKRQYGAAVVVPGSCQHCGTEETPQWRYVHREKFCNACYMRIKRWVHSHLTARKLPSRARMDVTEEDDAHFTQQAREIVQLALASLGGPALAR